MSRSLQTALALVRSLDGPPRMGGAGELEAHDRGIALRLRHLSPAQRQQFAERKHFDVVGGDSGTRYRIHYGAVLNVEHLDEGGRCQRLLCFTPKGYLPTGDVMLAQKIALELFEPEAIGVANTARTREYALEWRRSGSRIGRHH